ncbi:MAG: sensor histidine kinase [Candidatus Riflebacteria bacterium]|nr:sensor histidine kinase [Candidatus Riflebacteria bacterium]
MFRLHDLSLHILDLIENSLFAKATVISLTLGINKNLDEMKIRVEDNGEGFKVTPEQALNPFYTSRKTKKVGLGLSFFKTAAEMAGGGLLVLSSGNFRGAVVEARMKLSHVNRPPLGDLPATMSMVIFANPGVDFGLTMESPNRSSFFQLSAFLKEKDLNTQANVEVAEMVREALTAELKWWNENELSRWTP